MRFVQVWAVAVRSGKKQIKLAVDLFAFCKRFFEKTGEKAHCRIRNEKNAKNTIEKHGLKENFMKKIICKKEYDTDLATLIKKNTFGSIGDADGYEENLYQMPDGAYFLYVNGGKDSKYPKEDIKRLSKAAAEKML